jgi:hypothetical protein
MHVGSNSIMYWGNVIKHNCVIRIVSIYYIILWCIIQTPVRVTRLHYCACACACGYIYYWRE